MKRDGGEVNFCCGSIQKGAISWPSFMAGSSWSSPSPRIPVTV
jgi:hypothetical protein